MAIFVPGDPMLRHPALSGARYEPEWRAAIVERLDEPVTSPALTFVVPPARLGRPFDLDNLVHPVLAVLQDPIDSVSARLYTGEPVGLLIEDAPPEPPPPDALRSLRLEQHSKGSDRARLGIDAIVNDPPYVDHEGIGVSLVFDRADIPIRRGMFGPTEAVIDDLRPWLGSHGRGPADHRIRDLRIVRGNDPAKHGVTICVWYVPDEEVGVPDSLLRRIAAAEPQLRSAR